MLAIGFPLVHQLQQCVLHRHSERRGKLLAGDPALTLVDEVEGGVLQGSLSGKPSGLPDPKACGIELGDFADGQELSCVVVAREVPVLAQSSKDGGARATEFGAELLDGEHARSTKGPDDLHFDSRTGHWASLSLCDD